MLTNSQFNLKQTTFFIVILLLLVGSGCGKGKNIPDISDINIDLDIIRLEQKMYEVDSSQIEKRAVALAKDYPNFMEIYTHSQVMGAGTWRDSSAAATLAHLMRGKQLRMLYDTVMTKFHDFSTYEKELYQAFQFYKYYFPERPIPKVFTCITEFGYQGFTYGPEILAIGIEHYMGADFPAYNTMYPKFQSRFFTSQYLTSASMELFVSELVSGNPEHNMLDAMIREGKKLYILSHLLPYKPEHIVLKYTPEQAQWCEGNEFAMWKFFVDEELIYSIDKRKYMKYISPAPTSPGMPSVSPGRTASWIGWQIVKKYMQRNPNLTFEELLKVTDSKKILQSSRYKPRG